MTAPCPRFRVCQLVAKVMNYAADAQTKIGPDRLEKVQEVMLQRLSDKVSLKQQMSVVNVCTVLCRSLDDSYTNIELTNESTGALHHLVYHWSIL